MPKNIVEALCGLLLLFSVSISGCGNGSDESETVGGDSRTVDSIVKVAMCPSDGGDLKFLHLNSLKIDVSNIEIPMGTRYLEDIPSSPRIAAVTEDAILLIGEGDEPEQDVPILAAFAGTCRRDPRCDGDDARPARRARQELGRQSQSVPLVHQHEHDGPPGQHGHPDR